MGQHQALHAALRRLQHDRNPFLSADMSGPNDQVILCRDIEDIVNRRKKFSVLSHHRQIRAQIRGWIIPEMKFPVSQRVHRREPDVFSACLRHALHGIRIDPACLTVQDKTTVNFKVRV